MGVRPWLIGVVLGMIGALAGCDRGADRADIGRGPADGADAGTRIVVTIPPLAWAVREVAPEGAAVDVLLSPGASPHGFELSPGQVASVARADVVVMAGAGLEPAVDAALAAHPSPDRRVIRFEEVVEADELLEGACEHPDHHHHGHDHTHPTDPHFWLDPVLMERFVRRLGEEPAFAARAGRVDELAAACRAVDLEYVEALAAVDERRLIVQHDAYGYLCGRYGLSVVRVLRPIETVEPSPGDLVAAKRLIEDEGVPVVFIEPQFPSAAAHRLADLTGVKVLTLDPLGSGDWPATMRANLRALVEGLR